LAEDEDQDDDTVFARFYKSPSKVYVPKGTYDDGMKLGNWRHYLLGREFVVYAEQHSLKHLLLQRVPSADLQCWVSKLLGYQFEVIYRPGPTNKSADVMSQRDEDAELLSLVSFP
jgi:hypothetical protein